MSGAVDLSGLKARAEAANRPAAANGIAPVVAITEANFETEVLQRSAQVPVLVDLGVPRAPQSSAFTALLEKLAIEDAGTWVLAKVDVEANPRIAQAFRVQAVPTVIAVAAGQPLADLEGPQPEESVRQWLAAIARAVEGKLSGAPGDDDAPQPEDPRFVAADTALATGDLDAAAVAYRTIVDAEPNNAEARSGLRWVTFLKRAADIPADAVEQAAAAPDDIDKQFAAADALVRAQREEEGFAVLIAAVAATAGDDRTRVRTRLVELFELFEPSDEKVVAARRKLALALY